MKRSLAIVLFIFLPGAISFGQINANQALQVKTLNGIVEGIEVSGIRSFKGIPFAAAPLGNLRWREPFPVENWTGIRKADQFGPRAMQLPLYGDMVFRSNGMSEDCLYLNVWTPAKTGKENLPVLVYFYGGGFNTGDGSEYRYDGESMARRGIVAITLNYRVSIFGFFVHPELTKESPHHASGNYGLLDQHAALQWVQKNISAFGGDPKKVTIAGESAGSFAVSAQMASPLSKNLIAGAIGESGSLVGQTQVSLKDAEQKGEEFAAVAGAGSLAELRSLPAEQILLATQNPGIGRFSVVVDGYFFPKSPAAIYAAGEQAHVPLLAGWNSEEGSYRNILGQDKPTLQNFVAALQNIYGADAGDALLAYHASNDGEVTKVATDLASDRFIGYGTWKWIEEHSRTGGRPVYRYFYTRPRPAVRADTSSKPYLALGAVHSAEIEYAMGNLPTNRVYNWQPEDFTVSEIMQSYFVHFIKTGNPNGLGVPVWSPVINNKAADVMYIDVNTRAVRETNRRRYLFLEKAGKN